jgi:hypothetical protein
MRMPTPCVEASLYPDDDNFLFNILRSVMSGNTGDDEEDGATMRLDDPLFHDEQGARAAL